MTWWCGRDRLSGAARGRRGPVPSHRDPDAPKTTPGSILRCCRTCRADFWELRPGKTGLLGVWVHWSWYCSVECTPDRARPVTGDAVAVLTAHQPVGWHRTATACACGHQAAALAEAGWGDLRKPLGEAIEAELGRQQAEARLSALLADLQSLADEWDAEYDLLHSEPLDDLITRHTPEEPS